MIEQLSHDEAMAILEAGGDAHLGCVVDDEPYVVPVHYVLEGQCAYLHSLPGRKIEGMRGLPRVCLQVQEVRSEYRWRSVQAFGLYEEIEDPAEQERVIELLFARFPRLTPADAVRRHGRTGPPPIIFRIRIDRVVGMGEG
jgi:nitroimidazol reductase NimA-like FMN-containing flavoprotein (pyridoxamine 5'-phosphate oxidase superfamily)